MNADATPVRFQSLATVASILLLVAAGPAASEEKDEIEERLQEVLTDLRSDGRTASRPLLLYPEDVRDAVLEISQEPALIVRLRDSVRAGRGDVDALTADHPISIRRAAQTLVAEPEILEILEENLLLAGLIGSMYEDDPIGLKKIVDERAELAEKREQEAVEAWRKRLEENPEAMKEMEAARVAYEKDVVEKDSGDGVKSGGAESATGTTTSSGGKTTVYGTPSYSYSVYVMSYPYMYPSLSSQMYYYSVDWADYWDDTWDDYWAQRNAAREDWQDHLNEGREDRQTHRDERREEREGEERRGSRREDLSQSGNGGMNQAVKDWKESNGDSLPEDFFKNDGKLADRFKSYGEADRRFREGVRSGEYRASDRSKTLRELQRREARPAPRRQTTPQLAANPRREGSKLETGRMSRSQRMDRARSTHRTSWGSSSRSRGSRGSYGGGRRGGGGRRR